MKTKLFHALFALTFICHAVYTNAQTGNTKLGTNALLSNTTGDFNTALGYYSLNKNTTGGGNTAIGAYSLYNSVGGNNNTASGYASLRNNTTGAGNTASGHSSLYYNTTGAYNTANGHSSLNYNTTGRSNTASGAYSLRNNSTGDTNTASGHSSLYHNTTGNYNTASGAFSLYNNTTGNSNTASGYSSLRSNTTGRTNTASGASSLYKNTTGYSNTASGASSLYNNTNGVGNTASGYSSLSGNKTGFFNTASGAYSLVNNTTGTGNTAHGYYAMRSNTTGSYNTAVGDSAGAAFNYNYSTFIGYKTAVTVTGLTNVTVIGNLTSATASNQVRIGNSAVTSIGGKVGWTTLSDGRFKKNIKEDVPGLAFISNLRPVTYTVDIDALDKATGVIEAPSTEQITARNAAAQEKHTGFIAQEVEKAANELKYDFGGVDKPKNDKDLYGLRYSEFVVPLVMAVQELSRMNDEKNAKINELETRLLKLENLMNAQQSSSLISKQPINITTATLEQNIPNPFNHTTTIGYTLPQRFASAQIVMMDKNGNIVKQVNVSGSGKASMIIDATTLAAGVYSYSLLVDGKLIGTKQMVFIK